jgi:hypothetical protein
MEESEQGLSRDNLHTPWSDPGDLQARLGELPSDPAAIPDALENFVIRHAIARHMGLGVPEAALVGRPRNGAAMEALTYPAGRLARTFYHNRGDLGG